MKKKARSDADSCDLCARDIVDYCNSTDWVQLNQPGKDNDSQEVKVEFNLEKPIQVKKGKGQRQDTIRRKNMCHFKRFSSIEYSGGFQVWVRYECWAEEKQNKI